VWRQAPSRRSTTTDAHTAQNTVCQPHYFSHAHHHLITATSAETRLHRHHNASLRRFADAQSPARNFISRRLPPAGYLPRPRRHVIISMKRSQPVMLQVRKEILSRNRVTVARAENQQARKVRGAVRCCAAAGAQGALCAGAAGAKAAGGARYGVDAARRQNRRHKPPFSPLRRYQIHRHVTLPRHQQMTPTDQKTENTAYHSN